MSIKTDRQNERKHFLIFITVIIMHKLLFVAVCLWIAYANGKPSSLNQTMHKLIQLIQEEQVCFLMNSI